MKNKRVIFVFGFVFLLGLGFLLLFLENKSNINPNGSDVVCTMDAKSCPDGSFVGRIPPSCEFASCPNTQNNDQNSIGNGLILGIGQKGKVNGIEITLDSIVQDSRCPLDVQCIWAGQIVAKVKILSLGDTHKLETAEISSEKSYVFNGYNISISSVTPPKNSKKEIKSGDYLLTFNVSKK
jgi:hypothetical protein